jgi:hypothetical protein
MIKPLTKFFLQIIPLVLLSATNLFAQEQEQEQRLELEGTSIIGNKELPKILYIVPWKKAEALDISVPQTDSILDQPLLPIDRETFRRQVKYHQLLFPESKKSP